MNNNRTKMIRTALLLALCFATAHSIAQPRSAPRQTSGYELRHVVENTTFWYTDFAGEWSSTEDGPGATYAMFDLRYGGERYALLMRSCESFFRMYAWEWPNWSDSLAIDTGYHRVEANILFMGDITPSLDVTKAESVLGLNHRYIDSTALMDKVHIWERAFDSDGYKRHERSFVLNYYVNAEGMVQFIGFVHKVERANGRVDQEFCLRGNYDGRETDYGSPDGLGVFHNELPLEDFRALFEPGF